MAIGRHKMADRCQKGEKTMKDREIFSMLRGAIGISVSDVADYRPCRQVYVGDLGVPDIPDAIVVNLKRNGTLIYIPEHDLEGHAIKRHLKEQQEAAASVGTTMVRMIERSLNMRYWK